MALLIRSLILVASLLLAVVGDAAEPVIIKFCEVVESPADDVISVTGPDESKDKLLIRKAPSMDSTDIKEARVVQSPDAPVGQQSRLMIEFTESGSKKFAALTTSLIGKRLAILANDKVLTAPIIQSSITGGKAEISGIFTEQELKDLAAAMMLGIQNSKGAGG